MKVPRMIKKLIKQRMTYAEKMNEADVKINNWLEKNGIDFTNQYNDFGCMITTEPSVYASKTLEAIENKEDKKR